MGKNHMQRDSDSTMCAKNSDILLAENSLMDTEISISDEGSHAGEKEQYLNASLSKLQMFPSTSTFCTSEKSTYVLMNNDMWSALLSNTKCDECDMCSLDVECNSAYGFSTKNRAKNVKAAEKYLILYSPALEMMIAIVSMQIKSSLKLFLRLGKAMQH
ncbi:uncharacterized protein TNCV_1999971 [Trichonephila clavipes]|nr:uncharacterized protein TNCV_1999971 [Trichonephila clavipes]